VDIVEIERADLQELKAIEVDIEMTVVEIEIENQESEGDRGGYRNDRGGDRGHHSKPDYKKPNSNA